MKAMTHDIFSLGVGLYLLAKAGTTTPFTFVLLFWLAVATNEVIDLLGHVRRGVRLVRSSRTHSIFTAPVIGAFFALISAEILRFATGLNVPTPPVVVALLGGAIACSHLLLDALTEKGVFLWRRRIALAHLSYDNPILNATFAALGVLLCVIALL